MRALTAALLISVASPGLAAAPQTVEASQAQTPTPVAAPSAERLELARQFIDLVEPANGLMEVLRAGSWQEATAEIEDEDKRAIANERLDRLFTRLQARLHQTMPKLIEKYAVVYAREYSADELRALIAFAQSPTGKHYMKRDAALSTDPSLVEAQTEVWQSITPVMQDFWKEMCQEHTKERIAAGDTKAKCPLADKSETRAS
jgi:hypothetical protein